MEFMAAPEGVPHMWILDLGGPQYDRLGFDGYPDRMGWDLTKLIRGDVRGAYVRPESAGNALSPSIHELTRKATQFLQTWLYFGTLSEFFRREFLRCDHTRTVTDRKGEVLSVLCSSKILGYLEMFVKDTESSDAAARESTYRQCRTVLGSFCDVVWDLSNPDYWKQGQPRLPSGFPLWLRLLFNLLHKYVPDDTIAGYSGWPQISEGAKDEMEEAYRNQGFCPSVIRRIRDRIGLQGLYYYGLMVYLPTTRDHVDCTPAVCQANMVNEATYCTKHIANCEINDCGELTTPSLPLKSLVEHDRIPLIQLGSEYFNSAISPLTLQALEMCDGGTSTPFVAISHVWADGLGNPTENSLPYCQITKLKLYLTDLMRTTDLQATSTIWMDTLCIPPAPRETRNTAIKGLRKVFTAAQAVLVLDASLLSKPAPRTPEETLMYVFVSKWMSRLWTLQEGATARRIYFQFADRAVDAQKLVEEERQMSVFHPAEYVCSRAARSLLNMMLQNRPDPPTPGRLLCHYGYSMIQRSTSHERDMPVCVAAMIGCPLDKILAKNDALGRMEAFWSSMTHVPFQVIFVTGPRLDKAPLRWAPLDLFQRDILFMDDGSRLSLNTPSGLLIEGYLAVRIHLIRTPYGKGEFNFGFHWREPDVIYYILDADNEKSVDPSFSRRNVASNVVLLLDEGELGPTIMHNGILAETSGMIDSKTGAEKIQWLARVFVLGPRNRAILSLFERAAELMGRFHDELPQANEYISADKTWLIS